MTAAPAPSSVSPETDAVEAVLRALLAAGGRGDAAAIRSLVTDDLLLYKVGRVRGLADMLAGVEGFAAAGGAAGYALSDVVTRVDGTLAIMTFRSRAEIRLPGEPVRHGDWLESVHFRHDGERWRIGFYHSTDVATEG